jgi:hypothetical protein
MQSPPRTGERASPGLGEAGAVDGRIDRRLGADAIGNTRAAQHLGRARVAAPRPDRRDVIWSVVVPQAVAYAQIAGLPPEAGLMAAPGAMIA